MRNLKRVLTLVMAIAMLMSLMIVSTGAAFPDEKDIKNIDAVNMNVALNIIQGRPDGNFDPAGNITRGEMAKMITIARTGGTEPTLGTQITPSYTDIKGHWAEKYIEYCNTFKIIAGRGDGTFAPDANVTGTEAAKMLLVTIGYVAEYENFNGPTWASSIGAKASDKGLFLGTAIDAAAPLSRDNAAQMIVNALEASMVIYESQLVSDKDGFQTMHVAKPDTYLDSSSGTTISVAKTMLNQNYQMRIGYGILEEVNYNKSDKKYNHAFGEAANVPASGLNLDGQTMPSDKDYSDLFAQNVKVLYKEVNGKTTVYGMYAYKTKVMATGISDDRADSTKTGYVKFGADHYKAEDATGKSISDYTKLDVQQFNQYDEASFNNLAIAYASDVPLHFSMKLIDVDGDGAVDTAVYMPYTVGKATYVGTSTVTVGSKSYNVDDVKIFDGMKKNDYAQIVAAANTTNDTIQLNAVDKVVEGKVTASRNGVYTIGDAKYSIAKKIDNKTAYFTLNVGDTVKDAPSVNGFLFDADTTATVVVDDYAVIMGADNTTLQGNQAKLLMSDGTIKTVDTDVIYDGKGTVGDVNHSADKDHPDYGKIPAKTGALVKWDTNNDGDYTLAKAATDGLTGFDQAKDGGAITTTSNGKVKYLNGWDIADEAVIFVERTASGNEGFEVITGAKLKNLAAKDSAGNFTMTLNKSYAQDDSNSGYAVVKMAYVTTKAKLTTLNNKYAYLLHDGGTAVNSDNKRVAELSIWNGEKEDSLTGKAGLSYNENNFHKGDIISYSLNSDGKVDNLTVYCTQAKSPAPEVVAIISASKTDLTLANNPGTRYDITNSTVKLFFDGDKHVGQPGDIDIEPAKKDENNNYVNNAVVILDGGDVALIAYDVTNNLTDNAILDAKGLTEKNLTNALTENSTVTVTGDLTISVKVPANKTLNVTGAYTTSEAATIDGTLNVNGAVTLKHDTTLNGTMTVKDAAFTMNAGKILDIGAGATLTVDGTAFAGDKNALFTVAGSLKTDALTGNKNFVIDGNVTINQTVSLQGDTFAKTNDGDTITVASGADVTVDANKFFDANATSIEKLTAGSYKWDATLNTNAGGWKLV